MTHTTTRQASKMRRLAHVVRHAPDRALHPLRRRLRMRRLAALGPPRSVLFVCQGNICRSPYAAGAFLRALPDGWRTRVAVSSAGFVGPGRGSPTTALRVASRRGVDLTAHRSRLVSARAVERTDLVVVMDTEQRRRILRRCRIDSDRVLVLGDLDPQPITRRAIRDPLDQEEAAFEASYARIDRCVGELVGACSRQRHRPDSRRKARGPPRWWCRCRARRSARRPRHDDEP
ncbi:MAG: hypothetical protein ACODAE_08595 [Gemmatimonadota bacterium]